MFTLQHDALPSGTVLDAPMDWGGGFFSLGGQGQQTPRMLWLSVDGTEWESHALPVPSDQLLAVLPFAARLVAVSVDPGTADHQVRLWSSTDGAKWSGSEGPLVPVVAGVTATLSAAAFGGDVVVIEHESRETCCGTRLNGAASRPAGAAASAVPSAEPAPSGSAEPPAEGVWAWTQDSQSAWSRNPVTGSGGDLHLAGADGHDGLAITTLAGGASLVRSSDGVSWQKVARLPGDADPSSALLVAGLASGYVLAADTAAARHQSGSHLTIWTAGPTGKWKITREQNRQVPNSLATAGTTAVLGGEAIGLISPDGGASWSNIHHTGGGEPRCSVEAAIHRTLVVAVDTCESANATSSVLTLSLRGSSPP